MVSKTQNLTIGFSDIVGSSRLYSTLGNEKAKAKIDQGIEAMSDIVKNYGGEVIKTIGDEIMFSHPQPEAACEISVRMNRELNIKHFYLRTGLCFGLTILDHNDAYGDTVNNAAFLAKTANANQILIDANAYANLIETRKHCEYFDRIVLKGQSEESLIYRFNWEKSDTTSLDATMVANKAVSADTGMPKRLHVNFQDASYSMDANSRLIIGRDHTTAHLYIRHKLASRMHCTLSYNRGKFILEDHSTNGTYLLQQGQKEVFLRREATTLFANGKISLGQSCSKSDTLLNYILE